MKKLLFVLVAILVIGVGLFWLARVHKNPQVLFEDKLRLPVSQNRAEKLADYTFVFVGDSMTETLGNFDEIRDGLKNYYPNKTFLLLNYGFGSTSVLTLQDRINNDSTHSGRIFQPINNISYDAIFVESMGNNPLSDLPLDEGLKKQTEALDTVVSLLNEKHPKSPIIFIATIAPSKKKYGEGVVVLSTEEREKWVNERVAYIQNHMKYAKDHGILLIDIYDKSLEKNGDGNIDYLDSSNYIHPSPTGIRFISKEIADFVYQNNVIH